MNIRAVPVILFLNILVYLIWGWGSSEGLMRHHFLISWTALTEGRVWTLVTSVFSHNLFLHLLFNMLVLRSFGPVLESLLGTGRFVQFYLVAGIISSLSHSVVSAWVIGQPQWPALGASGAIAGLVLLFSLIYPREKLYLLGLIPVPAIGGALAFIALDLWGLMAQRSGGGLPIGHGAHLGGALTGIIFFFFWRRKQKAYLRKLS